MPPAAFDRRLTPARADLAAEHLRGLVDAPRYAKGRAHADRRGERAAEARSASRRAARDRGAPRRERHWSTTSRGNGPGRSSSATFMSATCRARRSERRPRRPIGSRRLRTHAYPAPSIKRPAAHGALARRAADDRGPRGRFRASRTTDFISGRAISPKLGAREPDAVAVAERFLETPYLWGGRTSEGIDCSGLVQTALAAAGDRVAARQRHAGGGARRARRDRRRAPLARGDLVFWKGHVGIMRDPVTLLHANGWHMKTASEPLARSAQADRRQWRRRGDERSETAGAEIAARARATSWRRCQARRSGC